MRVSWDVTAEDVAKIRAFLASREDDPLVRRRVARNLAPSKPEMARNTVWYRIIACLLSTQQRSGPTSATTRFLRQRPSPWHDVVVAAPNAVALSGMSWQASAASVGSTGWPTRWTIT